MIKIVLSIIPFLLMCGCKNNNSSDLGDLPVSTDNLGILSPVGAPAYAFYKEARNPNFETNQSPDSIVSSMTKLGDKKIVVIDTTSGIDAIKAGAPYKLAANLTFGNFFIAATGKDDNDTMDPGDKIVLFNKNGLPDQLFHYLYGNDYDEGIEYVTNGVGDAAKCLIKSKNEVTGSEIKYVFIAQPALTGALKQNTSASVYANVQNLYKEKTGGKELVQASLFVKNTLYKKIADQYLEELKGNIEAAVSNPDVITQEFEGLDTLSTKYGVAPSLAVAVLKNNNGLGLGFKSAYQNKENIDAFLANVQGKEATNEEIYYK